jgi:hypothetical protein
MTGLHLMFKLLYEYPMVRNGIAATGYGLEEGGVGVQVPVGSIIFTSPCRPDWLGPTQLPIRCVQGALSLVVNQPGHEDDHSSPTSVQVKKNVCLYIRSPTSSWHNA